MWEDVIKSAIKYYEQRATEINSRVSGAMDKAAKSPGAMESWSDKSKQEYSQLAEGLARELNPINDSSRIFKNLLRKPDNSAKIQIGSVVITYSSKRDGEEAVLIAPEVGGDFIEVAHKEYFLLSAKSELGKILLGAKKGDKIQWRDDELTIMEVVNS